MRRCCRVGGVQPPSSGRSWRENTQRRGPVVTWTAQATRHRDQALRQIKIANENSEAGCRLDCRQGDHQERGQIVPNVFAGRELGIRFGNPVYFEVALLIALVGFAGSIAMAKFLLRGEVIE